MILKTYYIIILMKMFFINFIIFMIVIPCYSLNLYLQNVDLGQVQSGEIVYATTELINETDTEVVIYDIITGCSCFNYLIGNRVCPPGCHTEIVIRFDSSGKKGGINQKLIINTNVGVIETYMYGSVKNDLISEPSTLIFDLIESNAYKEYINIWSSKEKFEILSLEYDKALMSVEVKKEISNDNKKYDLSNKSLYILELISNNEKMKNNFNNRLFIKVKTNSKIRKYITIEIYLLNNLIK